MKNRKMDYKFLAGPTLVAAGLALFAIPFIVVAIDNLAGTTRPADSLISNLGNFILVAGPVLVLIGLVLVVFRAARRFSR